MSSDQTQVQDAPARVVRDDVAPPEMPPRQDAAWSNLWQVPTIVISLSLIVAGFQIARQRAPAHDFVGAFDQIDRLVQTEQYDLAAGLLQDNIAPHLNEATDAHRGRYEALAADVLYFGMRRAGVWPPEHLATVTDRFERAARLGFELTPDSLERWADSRIRRGDVAGARSLLAKFDLQSLDSRYAEAASASRRRVLRQVIENDLIRDDIPYDDAMKLLSDYRKDPRIDIQDEIWAIARQAEMRFDAGEARQAIDRLQIDMRRLEPRVQGVESALGELYILLGHGFSQIGQFAFGEEQVNRALDLIEPSSGLRADALVEMANILNAQSRFDEAFDAFNKVVNEYSGSGAFADALLGRAEVNGILGRHFESQADYVDLIESLPTLPLARATDPPRIVESLTDRHDAALAILQLELALSYIDLTLKILPVAELPEYALVRLASTNAAIARRMLTDATGIEDVTLVDYERLDPQLRRQVSAFHRIAAEYFVAHAKAIESSPTLAAQWLESTWRAADNYDLAGYYDQAIKFFALYLESAADDHPRAIEAQFRLARCHQATLNFVAASQLFESVISADPRTLWATRSHVPLAACYVAMERDSQAEQQLLRVVSGREPLQPEALDYRDALFALGTLCYNEARYPEAISYLDRGIKAYPEDPRINEIRFRLADCYRGNAHQIDDRLAAGSLPRSEETELLTQRESNLREAMTLFALTADVYDRTDPRVLDQLQRDYQRFSHLYVADCAFEMGEYERSIELYDLAARRYADHPSSVVALIQIVNAYAQLGDAERAKTAHNRALLRLQQLPPEALDDPTSIFDDAAWRRWLQELPPGLGLSRAAQDGANQ